jgi:hypothetical protein
VQGVGGGAKLNDSKKALTFPIYSICAHRAGIFKLLRCPEIEFLNFKKEPSNRFLGSLKV